MDPVLVNLVKIVIAVILGGIIGYERERHGHFAGIRTHIMVCLASAVMIAVFSDSFASDSTARIGAAIITGIGFIGAGTILSQGGSVKGLTTAASVWGVAALGIIIGIGAYWEAAFVAFTMVVILEMTQFSAFKLNVKRK